jgi:probable HAF family extracellular repeat protein
MWQDGVMTDLGHLGSGISAAESVNNLGDAVGYSYDASYNAYATLWHDGTLTNLGTPDGAVHSMALDINDSGQIVGQAYYASEGWQAVLYEDGVWTNLNDFLPAGSLWVLGYPVAMNSSGQIAGYGTYGGETRAFLLTPDATVPAPGALVLGLLGLGGIGAAKRARKAAR